MFLIVGLGNPGQEYVHTRHNIGFRVVSEFREKNSFPPFKRNTYINGLISETAYGSGRVTLLLPQTFMNRSGESVRQFLQRAAKMPEIIVVHDELDLSLGRIKLTYDRGAGGHHGVESIVQHIGGTDFMRLRVGIAPVDRTDGREDELTVAERKRREGGSNFVLGDFTQDEQEAVTSSVQKAVGAIDLIIASGRESAATLVNARA